MKKIMIPALLCATLLTACGADAETYAASAKGFGGDVTVSVTMENGKIIAVEAVGESETAGIGSRAIEELPAAIVAAGTADVDGVSGATYTSEAIKSAAAQAIADAKGEEVPTVAADMTPGTYRGQAKGMNGIIVVDVTVDEEKILGIKVVETIPRENDLIDETHWLANYLIDMLDETPQIFSTVVDRLPQRIVDAQSLSVDAVAGATVSSNGLIAAVRNAIELSGGNPAAFNRPVAKVNDALVLDADVVVLGGGTSGAAAAARAKEAGAKVVLIEKSARVGGTGALSSEPMTFNSDMQTAAGIHSDVSVTFEDWMAQNHWSVNGRLVSQFLNNSGKVGDWLIANGFKFTPGTTTDTTLAYRDHSIGTMTQKESFEEMTGKVDTILYETTAHDLIVEDGIVKGVKATRYDGTEVTVNAKAVIVATGGFGGSYELMNKYNSGYYKLLGLTQNVGEGLNMMLAAGAQAYHVGGACAHQTEVPVQVSGFNAEDTAIPYTITNLPVLMRVTKNGQRFMDEDEKVNSPTASSNYVSSNGPEYFALLTGKQMEVLHEQGSVGLGMDKQADPSFYTWPVDSNKPMTNIEQVLEAACEIGMAFKGNTLEELAEVTGMDIDVLRRNVADYNASCEAKLDNVFFKNPNYLYPYDEDGPFYAVVGCVMSYNSLGGVKVDELMRVADENDKPIVGLYAAGVDSIGTVLDGVSYPNLFGVALGWGFSSGYMAGESAAAFAAAN